MASHARKGHSGQGGRGARDPVARAAPLSLADAVIAIMRDPKVKLPPPFDRLDVPTPPALRVEDARKDSLIRHARPCAGHPRLSLGGTQDVDGRDKPGHDENSECAIAAQPQRVEPRDHDVERIVSDPHPGYRWI
jgi:hypothetical protein